MVMAKRKTESIHAALLDRICLLEYPPRTMLREGELAAEFGTSRTPIREVLLRLSLLGLVQSRSGVGTFVTDIDQDAYRDICEMRLKVAELIGEMAPRSPDEDDLQWLERIAAGARELLQAFDLRTYWRLNHELHFLVRGLIGNAALRDLWDRYYYQTARLFYSVVTREPARTADAFVSETDAMLRAMRNDDMKAVGHIQRSCIANGMRRVDAALREGTGARGVAATGTDTPGGTAAPSREWGGPSSPAAGNGASFGESG